MKELDFILDLSLISYIRSDVFFFLFIYKIGVFVLSFLWGLNGVGSINIIKYKI